MVMISPQLSVLKQYSIAELRKMLKLKSKYFNRDITNCIYAELVWRRQNKRRR